VYGNIHGAAHVFDRGLRRHGAEGDDRATFSRPTFGDVIDHLAAPVHAEVDVDVGQ